MKGLIIITLAGFLMFAACSSSTSSEDYNLTGNWSGNIRFATLGVSATVSYSFTQSGTTITGTFTIDTGRNGTFSGTLSGSTLSGTMTFQDACTGTASVSGTVKSSNSVDGSGTANDCNGTNTFTFSIGKS